MNIIKKIKEKYNKRIDDFNTKVWEGTFDLQRDLSNKNSKMYCQFCHKHMSFFKRLICANHVKQGEKYTVKCKYCKKINTWKKGVDPLDEDN